MLASPPAACCALLLPGDWLRVLATAPRQRPLAEGPGLPRRLQRDLHHQQRGGGGPGVSAGVGHRAARAERAADELAPRPRAAGRQHRLTAQPARARRAQLHHALEAFLGHRQPGAQPPRSRPRPRSHRARVPPFTCLRSAASSSVNHTPCAGAVGGGRELLGSGSRRDPHQELCGRRDLRAGAGEHPRVRRLPAAAHLPDRQGHCE